MFYPGVSGANFQICEGLITYLNNHLLEKATCLNPHIYTYSIHIYACIYYLHHPSSLNSI